MTEDTSSEHEDSAEGLAAPEAAVEPVMPAPSDPVAPVDSKRKWHDRKWLLIATVAIGSMLLGVGISAPDRTAAAKEAKATRSHAASDAKQIRREASDDAEETASDAEDEATKLVEEAQATRDAKLGKIVADRAKIVSDIRKLTQRRADMILQRISLTGDVNDLKRELGKLTTEKRLGTFEGDGMYMVGSEVLAGTYRAPASPGCYYAVLSSLDGSLGGIMSNGNPNGPVLIDLRGAKAVEVARCGTFTKVG